MKILVVNCGSSSLKYQLIDMEGEKKLASGIFDRIGESTGAGGKHVYKPTGKEKVEDIVDIKNHAVAVELLIKTLTDPNIGVIKSLDEIDALGHRIVHGGEYFSHSVLIDEDVKKKIKEVSPLAPLHNPAHLMGIETCEKLFPGVPQVAVFDTAFHQTMPQKAFLFAIPYEYYKKYKIRRYGFHGTSHDYVSKRAAEFLGLDLYNSKLIICHLGSGASVTAVRDGVSVDTSMGLTPLDGLAMGTRSGNIDPSVIEYLVKNVGMSIDEVMNVLNKKSGLYGISDGMSSDFRDLESEEADNRNEAAHLAISIFCYRVAKYIGSYAAAMNGVDAIVFTAGIGENNPMARARILKYLEFLGVKVDDKANDVKGEDRIISTPDSKVLAAAIPTNEEIAIARDTKEIVEDLKN
ncbi:MAG TPA: acetate kinase [Lachnospiraceae bacterium]|nr:acetate kinase [Lachnospiraceae bacterium]HBR04646.1 acetate kinase [Lachnospiraceae bacterium]HBZ89716.1 acetate kinase [Lachnospiraceae bacterium]